MKTDLDLKELAIDRDSATNSVLRVRAHLLTRYVLPLTLVIGFFDATIDQIVALAVLMPIVASMGGNAGTQTLTVAVRALAMNCLLYTSPSPRD